MPSPCTGPCCTRDAEARGLCHTHLVQDQRGRPLTPIREADGPVVLYPAVRVPPELLSWCQARARSQGLSLSRVAREALELLRRLEP